MPGLPTGTVTFLFTDIEGSTKLAQAHPVVWEAGRTLTLEQAIALALEETAKNP